MPPPTIAAIEAEWCGARNGPPVGELAAAELAGDRARSSRLRAARPATAAAGSTGSRARQHRLAGAGRPDHQQIVAAGRRDLERPLGALLALDVGEVGRVAAGGAACSARGATAPGCRGNGWRSRSGCAARGSSMSVPAQAASGPHAAGQISPRPSALAADRRGQRARDAARSCRRATVRRAPRYSPSWSPGMAPSRGHQAERDRQIVVAALLGQVGRREVDDDPLGAAAPGRTHAAPRAPARGSRPPPCRAGRRCRHMLARRHVHLHVDRHRLDALKRNRRDVCNHPRPLRPYRAGKS